MHPQSVSCSVPEGLGQPRKAARTRRSFSPYLYSGKRQRNVTGFFFISVTTGKHLRSKSVGQCVPAAPFNLQGPPRPERKIPALRNIRAELEPYTCDDPATTSGPRSLCISFITDRACPYFLKAVKPPQELFLVSWKAPSYAHCRPAQHPPP